MRFVSTPEVLERFVSVEKEIVQIENELSATEEDGMAAALSHLLNYWCLHRLHFFISNSRCEHLFN